MKRDLDLAREIMKAVEADPLADGFHTMIIHVEGYSDNEVAYHIQLLHDAGLVENKRGAKQFVLDRSVTLRLTWAGHEFVTVAREEGRWDYAKRFVLERNGALGFEVLKGVLVRFAKDDVLKS